MRRRKMLLVWMIFTTLVANAQINRYPAGYFRNPLEIPMSLAANFGELRPDHWHMGLDIRTAQRENQPVHAAADGYIAHIGIRPQSFGRFIIINHPNGMSTLYGHLNDFFPALEECVTAQQYQKETWAIELDFKPNQFPVTKGAFIAFSGNTGGSQGPHVHFEIFDTRSEKRFNPLLFHLSMEDDVPPTITRLAMYDRERSVYQQTPVYFTIKNTDSGYILPKEPVINTGLRRVGFAVQAFDRMSNSSNRDGIFSGKVFVDDQPISSFELDSIDYDQTMYVNAQTDYRLSHQGGPLLQELFPEPGIRGIYRKYNDDGNIQLTDTLDHAVRIEIADAYGNVSIMRFMIRHDDALPGTPSPPANTRMLVPNKAAMFENPGFEIYFDKDVLYDTVPVSYLKDPSMSTFELSARHQLNDGSIPLHHDVVVRIRPDRPIPAEWQDKLLMVRSDRKSESVRHATWQDKWLAASFGDLGGFQLVADTIPPKINDPAKAKEDTLDLSSLHRIVFTPSDNFGALQKFRAEIDGKWIRFTNDKSRNWIYNFDDRVPYGVHSLTVSVEDRAGNSVTRQWWFRRHEYTAPPKIKKTSKPKSKSKGPVKAAPKKKTKK